VVNYCLTIGGMIVFRRTALLGNISNKCYFVYHKSPTSPILAEIFIQHLEHNHIANILKRHHIIDYYRYVDDILIIYNEDYFNIEDTLAEFNSIHPNIQYTIEKQINNKPPHSILSPTTTKDTVST
jgi:hypothetical protein